MRCLRNVVVARKWLDTSDSRRIGVSGSTRRFDPRMTFPRAGRLESVSVARSTGATTRLRHRQGRPSRRHRPTPRRSGPANPSKEGCNSAGAQDAGPSALESTSFILRQTAPHAKILPRLHGPFQARLSDLAATADRLRLADLDKRGTGVPDREEQAPCRRGPSCGAAWMATGQGHGHENHGRLTRDVWQRARKPGCGRRSHS